MSNRTAPTLGFDSASVAERYDRVLAPALFEPWAERLIDENRPWEGLRVLDLATGTGVVAQGVHRAVGPFGEVVGADINPQMLEFARRRCGSAAVFMESGAHPLRFADSEFDRVICQQGFQFFPDKPRAAREILRVLRPGGFALLTTWLPVEECEIFGAICGALEAIGEPAIAAKMRVPFDHLPAAELVAAFEQAGFERPRVVRKQMDLALDGGIAHAIDFAYATPIGPLIDALPAERQAVFREQYRVRIEALDAGAGRMATNELTACRTCG